jgi:hypothetical protein
LSEIDDLQRLADSFVGSAREICGITSSGKPLNSAVRDSLLKTGDYVASHLTEGYVSTVVSAVYIYLAVTLGVPLLKTIWRLALDVIDPNRYAAWWTESLIAGYTRAHLDAHLYVFLFAYFVATMHRKFTGRRIHARTIVIAETTANYKLLRAYVSKLKALSFGITSFGVAGQNPMDHLVHEMTHLATSEVLLAVGRPDGRLGSLAATEAACLMSIHQARFISATPCGGVEAISVGHNPYEKAGVFSHAVVLPTAARPEFLSTRLLRTGKGPHHPGDVTSKVAEITDIELEGKRDRALFPKVEIEDVVKMMSSVRVSLEEAETIISAIVAEHADHLGIDASLFNVRTVMRLVLRKHGSTPSEKEKAHTGTGSLDSMKTEPRRRSISETLVSIIPTMASPRVAPHQKQQKRPQWSSAVTVASKEIMLALRGKDMQKQIYTLRSRFKGIEVLRGIARQLIGAVYTHLLESAFAGWATHVRIQLDLKLARTPGGLEQLFLRRSGGASMEPLVSSLDAIGTDLPTVPFEPEWRAQEHLRRVGRSIGQGILGSPLMRCFTAWREATENTHVSERAKYIAAPVELPVFSGLLGKVEGKDLLAELAIVEGLYESRVGAAERLLAFFVLFHRAVKPVSKLPGLYFDMDRSESRLRVASTPAPVAFVENLPPEPRMNLYTATSKIQRNYRQHHARKGRCFVLHPEPPPERKGRSQSKPESRKMVTIAKDVGETSPGGTSSQSSRTPNPRWFATTQGDTSLPLSLDQSEVDLAMEILDEMDDESAHTTPSRKKFLRAESNFVDGISLGMIDDVDALERPKTA